MNTGKERSPEGFQGKKKKQSAPYYLPGTGRVNADKKMIFKYYTKRGRSCSWCKPKVAEKPPPPRGGRRAQEPSTGTPPPPPPLSLRAPPLSQIFSLPTDPPLSALASTPWAIRLLILLHHRLLAEAAARCPVWAREARDPQQRTPGRARPLVGARKGRGDGMQSGRR